ncbi:hypothetical protein, partial [Mycobacteroides abscessus]|uniref:hypothetical protein n=1 Tax=Mycobacteroides abscessus TaxID=36809 RepID=UPI001A95B5BC
GHPSSPPIVGKPTQMSPDRAADPTSFRSTITGSSILVVLIAAPAQAPTQRQGNPVERFIS